MIRTSRYAGSTKEVNTVGWRAGSFGAAIGGLTKRSLDIVGSLLGLMILFPLFALIGVLIKRDSSGPVLYKGSRIGRNGVIFQMLKFRTMYEDSRSYRGPRVTGKDDPRITIVGKWLRDTKLNELPQLWNVLIGDMSLVGPRPEDPTIGKKWPVHIAREILSVRPGITSPASVIYRDEENMLAATEVMRQYLYELSPDKMRLDQLYVRYRSFWLDLDVIFWTFLLLLPKVRAYAPPEHLLFIGPVSKLVQRYISWLLWDFLVVLLSTAFIGGLARLFGPLNVGWEEAMQLAVAFSGASCLVGILLGIDRIDWRKATLWQATRLWATWLIVITGSLTFQHFAMGPSLRISGMILAASLLSFAGMVVVRYRTRLLIAGSSLLRSFGTHTRALRERVLIVGSGRTAEHIAWLLDHPTFARRFQVVGLIDNDMRSRGMRIYGSQVIGGMQDLETIIKQHDIGLIILAESRMAAQEFHDSRNAERFRPARIVVAPDIYGSLQELSATNLEQTAGGSPPDFQCQYCLARFAANSGGTRQPANKPAARTRRRRSKLEAA